MVLKSQTQKIIVKDHPNTEIKSKQEENKASHKFTIKTKNISSLFSAEKISDQAGLEITNRSGEKFSLYFKDILEELLLVEKGKDLKFEYAFEKPFKAQSIKLIDSNSLKGWSWSQIIITDLKSKSESIFNVDKNIFSKPSSLLKLTCSNLPKKMPAVLIAKDRNNEVPLYLITHDSMNATFNVNENLQSIILLDTNSNRIFETYECEFFKIIDSESKKVGFYKVEKNKYKYEISNEFDKKDSIYEYKIKIKTKEILDIHSFTGSWNNIYINGDKAFSLSSKQFRKSQDNPFVWVSEKTFVDNIIMQEIVFETLDQHAQTQTITKKIDSIRFIHQNPESSHFSFDIDKQNKVIISRDGKTTIKASPDYTFVLLSDNKTTAKTDISHVEIGIKFKNLNEIKYIKILNSNFSKTSFSSAYDEKKEIEYLITKQLEDQNVSGIKAHYLEKNKIKTVFFSLYYKF